MKTFKVNVPEGYEIDKEKSTFENIVFKKKDDAIMQWNVRLCGVEIKADGEHFVVDAESPSFHCSWDDAMRFYNTKASFDWKLPTIRQLHIIAKYINKINEVIRKNGGYEISGWLWSCEEEIDFCAWGVSMDNGNTNGSPKNDNGYVRAVSAL